MKHKWVNVWDKLALVEQENERLQKENAELKIKLMKSKQVKQLQKQAEELQKENAQSLEYAKHIVLFMWGRHCKKESPCFQVADDLQTVLSQIDNMVCGLKKK